MVMMTVAGIWTGRVLSCVVVLLLLADGLTAIFAPSLIAADMKATGFPTALAGTVGLIAVVCAAILAVPQTAVLGAILTTGFLGGAICTHFRTDGFGSPPQLICLALGLAAWGGLYLRKPALRALTPVAAV